MVPPTPVQVLPLGQHPLTGMQYCPALQYAFLGAQQTVPTGMQPPAQETSPLRQVPVWRARSLRLRGLGEVSSGAPWRSWSAARVPARARTAISATRILSGLKSLIEGR